MMAPLSVPNKNAAYSIQPCITYVHGDNHEYETLLEEAVFELGREYAFRVTLDFDGCLNLDETLDCFVLNLKGEDIDQEGDIVYARTVCGQGAVCQLNLIPQRAQDGVADFRLNYFCPDQGDHVPTPIPVRLKIAP